MVVGTARRGWRWARCGRRRTRRGGGGARRGAALIHLGGERGGGRPHTWPRGAAGDERATQGLARTGENRPRLGKKGRFATAGRFGGKNQVCSELLFRAPSRQCGVCPVQGFGAFSEPVRNSEKPGVLPRFRNLVTKPALFQSWAHAQRQSNAARHPPLWPTRPIPACRKSCNRAIGRATRAFPSPRPLAAGPVRHTLAAGPFPPHRGNHKRAALHRADRRMRPFLIALAARAHSPHHRREAF